jgi:Tat protein translocase TatB subunit
MLNIGPQELLVILVIALVVVGPHRLPELGRSIGHWVRELRKAQDEVKRTIRVGLDEPTGEPAAGPTDNGGTPAAPRPTATPGVQDPTPTAGTTPTADEVREISRSLGRSLGQLRRAREDVQRSFRIDLDAPSPPPASKSARPAPNGSASDAAERPGGDPPAHDGPAPAPSGSGDGDPPDA